MREATLYVHPLDGACSLLRLQVLLAIKGTHPPYGYAQEHGNTLGAVRVLIRG